MRRPAGWGRLELGEDAGGGRLFLRGEAVHLGTGLELLLPGDQVLRVRLEGRIEAPVLHFKLGGAWEREEHKPACTCIEPDFPRDDEDWPSGPCTLCGKPAMEHVPRAPQVTITGPELLSAFLRWPEDSR